MTLLQNLKCNIRIRSGRGPVGCVVLNQSGVGELCAVSASTQGHVWFTEDITISTITVRKHEICISEIYYCCTASALTYNASALILTFLAPAPLMQFARRSNVAICWIPEHGINSVTTNRKEWRGAKLWFGAILLYMKPNVMSFLFSGFHIPVKKKKKKSFSEEF